MLDQKLPGIVKHGGGVHIMRSMECMRDTSLRMIEISIKGIDVPSKRERGITVEERRNQGKGRKLVLSKKIQAALVTIGLFSEEQADVIVNETQANLTADC